MSISHPLFSVNKRNKSQNNNLLVYYIDKDKNISELTSTDDNKVKQMAFESADIDNNFTSSEVESQYKFSDRATIMDSKLFNITTKKYGCAKSTFGFYAELPYNIIIKGFSEKSTIFASVLLSFRFGFSPDLLFRILPVKPKQTLLK